jgi:hypothetical protein
MTNKLKCDVSPNGDKRWHLNGLFHREDGPAIEWADGILEWYLNGNSLDPHYRVNDLELQFKYPKLIESMNNYLAVCQIHNS